MSASRAFYATFTEKALVPSEFYDWDDYNYRMLRYALAEAYYANTSYSSISSFAARLKADRGLYKHLRSLYNPVNRLVEFYVGAVYGGELDFEEMSGGAMPILMADDALKEAIRQTWKWSNWRTQKNVYVRQGAMLGDVGLYVVDEPDKQKVRIEVLHPGKIKETEVDGVGNIQKAVIEYERDDTPDNVSSTPRAYTYRLEVDKDRFATFKDGQPFAFYKNARGQEVTEWANEYGFVPLVAPKHKDMGLKWGASPYHAQYPLIDEMNDAASILNDAIRKSVNIIWYFAGAQAGDLRPGGATDANGNERKDSLPAIYGPEGSQPHAMVPNVDIAAAGGNLDRMIQEMERNNPELSLHRLREDGNLTAPGVRTAYTDALNKAKEAQGNYDDGYIRAQQMAVSIGGYRGYEGFESFNLDSYDNGDLQFYIKPRPVIGDSLSKQERLTAFISLGNTPPALQRLALRELDVNETEIDEIIADQEAQKQANMQQAAAVAGNEQTADSEETQLPPQTNGQRPQQSVGVMQSPQLRTLNDVLAALEA